MSLRRRILSGIGVLPFPGPVIGLVLLLANLALIGEVPQQLGRLADIVLAVLGMLFMSTGVGLAPIHISCVRNSPDRGGNSGRHPRHHRCHSGRGQRVPELETKKRPARAGEATDAAI
jgi:hypothetical protein